MLIIQAYWFYFVNKDMHTWTGKWPDQS